MNEMPDEARVWIYQMDRMLSDTECSQVSDELVAFLNDWTSHGSNMDAAFEIMYSRLLVIAVDESRAMSSGCGIDKSQRFVKALGDKMKIDFFNRTSVLFMKGSELVEAPLHQFWALRKALVVDDETMIVDTTVRTVGEIKKGIQKPFGTSWHAEMWGR